VGRGPLYALDRKREGFRDDLMRHWQRLRERILEEAIRWAEAGRLERVNDVFLLDREDLRPAAPLPDLAARRAELARLARVALPTTATRDAIEVQLASSGEEAVAATGARTGGPFPGIALSRAVFEGTVRRADDLVRLLEEEREAGRPLLDRDTVLVVPALEPSWGVVFGRVGAVITELGGELSHASILLREAGKPALVNCEGIYDALRDGARVRLDGTAGLVTLLAPGSPG
jgi:phosphohistidine swiveling domain-containing protein